MDKKEHRFEDKFVIKTANGTVTIYEGNPFAIKPIWNQTTDEDAPIKLFGIDIAVETVVTGNFTVNSSVLNQWLDENTSWTKPKA